VAFARRTGQPLADVLAWHPRDLDTWLAMDEESAQEARFAQLRREHREQMGR
jgi:hypothetical protein